MNTEDIYHKTKYLIEEAKIPIAKAEYSAQQFGNWWIIVNVNKLLLRAVWNSRDRWVVIQRMTDEVFNGQFVWHDEWTLKRKEDLTPENICYRFKKIYENLAK